MSSSRWIGARHSCTVSIFMGCVFFTCLLDTNLSAKPELFVEAVKFGAQDCGFCHQTAGGGTSINDRGAWLVAERIRRESVGIDINWLLERGDKLTEKIEESGTQESAALTAQATDRSKSTKRTRAPFDYTTQWGEWPSYGGNLKAQKYSPLALINQKTVHQLELAWIWEAKTDSGMSRDFRNNRRNRRGGVGPFKGTPLMVDGKVFVRTRYSTVVAIDAETGEELWEFDPGTRHGPVPPIFGFATRGLGFHHQPDCKEGEACDRIILLSTDGWMIAIDTETGEPIPLFGKEGKVDLTVGLRRPLNRSQVTWSHPPLVCEDVVIVGSQISDNSQFDFRVRDWKKNLPLGDVRGFDPVSGKQLWVFKTVPQEGEVGVETWGEESWRWAGNTNVWSTFSCDPDLGHVYLPVTASTNHMYGGDRPGDNLFSTSVVAVDVHSGEYVWHFQITHHDIWDYDLPAPPVVADIVVDGDLRKVVAQVTKVGYLFVLDRLTGDPVWPVVEREVPPSTLEGEVASPTQPHPTKPPPFEMQGFSLEDVNALTPELRRRSTELVSEIDIGPLYTPISVRGTVFSPGIGGGANWTGAAFNPETRQLFVSSRREPLIANAVPIDINRHDIPYRERWRFPKIEGLPFVKPPWSNITSYDLDEGKIAWQVTNGAGPKDHPLLSSVKDSLPDLGEIYAYPGLLALPDLLIMGHRGVPTSTIKALDPSTGKKLWSADLVGYFDAPPAITYLYQGKQYLSIGTGHSFEPSRVVTFVLDPSAELP